MITNEAIRRLIACDREALIALMAAARADGHHSHMVPDWVWADPDADELLRVVRREMIAAGLWHIRRQQWAAWAESCDEVPNDH